MNNHLQSGTIKADIQEDFARLKAILGLIAPANTPT